MCNIRKSDSPNGLKLFCLFVNSRLTKKNLSALSKNLISKRTFPVFLRLPAVKLIWGADLSQSSLLFLNLKTRKLMEGSIPSTFALRSLSRACPHRDDCGRVSGEGDNNGEDREKSCIHGTPYRFFNAVFYFYHCRSWSLGTLCMLHIFISMYVRLNCLHQFQSSIDSL